MSSNNEKKTFKVCLCGKPNVGKSSIFNRLVGKKNALVLDMPGVTRDVKTSLVHWNNESIEIADLAGLEIGLSQKTKFKEKPGHLTHEDFIQLQKLAMEAAIAYLKESDLILFIVDGRSALTPADEEIASLIRNSGKTAKVILSKAESTLDDSIEYDVLNYQWDEPLKISAEHNQGVEDLKLYILNKLTGKEVTEIEDTIAFQSQKRKRSRVDEGEARVEPPKGSMPERPITIGVYGRPNVGKSTLVNRILGTNRMLVSPIAGTTVDVVDTDFIRNEVYYKLLDTAGIRRKSKTEEGVEVLSVVQALSSLKRADVALFLIDGYEGVTDQDEKVVSELIGSGRPVVIIVNKWDLCATTQEEYAERLRDTLKFLDFAPVLFTCAKTGKGVEPLFDLLHDILEQRMKTVSNAEMNRVIKGCENKNNPKNARIYYSVQISKNPPTISIQINDKRKMHYSFERFISNELRKSFGWMGSPLKLIFKEKSRPRKDS